MMYYEEPDSIPRDILVQMPMDMYPPMDTMDRSKGKAKFAQSPTGEAPIAAKSLRLGHAYVPDQPYGRLFSLREALHKGTLFADLYDPYHK